VLEGSLLEAVDRWLEVIEVVRRNRLRTALTMLGVFWGMFMLLLMAGFGNGLEDGVRRTLGGSATNAVFVWGQATSLPYKGLQPGREVDFVNEDVGALKTLPGAEIVAPRGMLGGFRNRGEVRAEGRSGAYQVAASVPEYRHIEAMTLIEGRFVNPLDLRDARKVAVIGAMVADELFETRGPEVLGRSIQIRGVWFQVVGVLQSRVPGDRGERNESTVHIPLATYQQAFNQGDRIGWFALTATPDSSGAELEEAARALLSERHAVHPEDAPALGSYNAEEEFRRMQRTFAGIRLFVGVVGVLTLLSGVFGVSNILLITVRERTAEIGLRRALGARRRSIVAMILREALMLTGLSGYAGLVAGVGVLTLASTLLGPDHEVLGDPQVDLDLALLAGGALLVAAALAALVPARHAAAISPVEALRNE
jgi:putative ABC transport system permease protein